MREYTAEEIRADITPEFKAEVLKSLLASEEVPAFMKGMDKIQDMWIASCWLKAKLKEADCPEKDSSDIQFAMGQRCLFNDPYKVASFELSSFLKGIHDKPGPELAAQLCQTHLVSNDP